MRFRLRCDLAGQNALIKLIRLRRGLDAQLPVQGLAESLILGQGSRSLAGDGQQIHQLLVGILLPGLDLYLLPGVAQGAFVGPLGFMVGGQTVQGTQPQPGEVLPVEQQPLLKGGTVPQRESRQKLPPEQPNRLLQLEDGLLAESVFGQEGG